MCSFTIRLLFGPTLENMSGIGPVSEPGKSSIKNPGSGHAELAYAGAI